MFKTAHIVPKSQQNRAGLAVSQPGTRLVGHGSVFKKFTYREFSLLIGILVAVIILLSLWLNPFTLEYLNTGSHNLDKKSSVKALTEKVITHIQDSLR